MGRGKVAGVSEVSVASGPACRRGLRGRETTAQAGQTVGHEAGPLASSPSPWHSGGHLSERALGTIGHTRPAAGLWIPTGTNQTGTGTLQGHAASESPQHAMAPGALPLCGVPAGLHEAASPRLRHVRKLWGGRGGR